ncbi:MAG: TRAP transporter substrate-binding protein [Synergistaceae bacterium]|jgi:tripartite ATP-independent transporter DctP family solute receptor|nr:TRAP transporter substrate-binding protein [Synergistaceae bacterium]
MKKILRLIAVSVLLLTAFGAADAFAADVIEIKMGFAESDISPHYQGYKKIAEKMETLSNGLLKVTLFPSNTLGSERDLYEGAQIGIIDALIITNAVLTNFVPEAAVLDQPFLFATEEEAHKVIDGKLGDMLKAASAKKGVQIVGWCDSGFRDVFSAVPIKTNADIKGKKIRTMENAMHMAAYNAIGAIATPMPFGDVFTALQQKTVDGYENSVANLYANHFYEVCKYAIRSRVHFAFQGVCISNKVWDRIPNDLKPALLKGIQEGCDLERQLLHEANEKYEKELVEKFGMVFSDVDRDALKALAMPAMSQFKLNQEWLDVLNSELAAIR